MTMSVGFKNKVLSFPNESRSFDSRKNCVRFWGYDSAIEISFFVAVDALQKLSPEMSRAEAEILKTFDAVRERIHEAANKIYVRDHKGAYAYTLAAQDF